MNKSTITRECGCVEEISTTQQGNYLETYRIIIKMCKLHEKIKRTEAKKEKLFNSFPSKKAKATYRILTGMIEKLEDVGVDVSYFPEEAFKILKKTAIKISKKS